MRVNPKNSKLPFRQWLIRYSEEMFLNNPDTGFTAWPVDEQVDCVWFD